MAEAGADQLWGSGAEAWYLSHPGGRDSVIWTVLLERQISNKRKGAGAEVGLELAPIQDSGAPGRGLSC